MDTSTERWFRITGALGVMALVTTLSGFAILVSLCG
jgi:hypothetical protein